MFYSGCFGIPGDIPLSFYFLWVFDKVFSMILYWFTFTDLLSNVGYFFLLYYHSKFTWVPMPMSCQPLRWLVPSLFSHSFLLLMHFPKSSLLTFLSGVSLESWLLISLSSRFLQLIFSNSAFLATFPFVIFSEWVDFISDRLKVFLTTSLCGSSS